MRGVLLISLLAVLFACVGPPDLHEAVLSVEVSVQLLLDGDPAGAVRALGA